MTSRGGNIPVETLCPLGPIERGGRAHPTQSILFMQTEGADYVVSSLSEDKVKLSQKMRERRRPRPAPDLPCENPTQIERPPFQLYSAKGGGKHLDQIPRSGLTTRLELLRNIL